MPEPREPRTEGEPTPEMKKMLYNLVEGFKSAEDEKRQIEMLEAIEIAIERGMEGQWTTREPDLEYLERYLRNYLNSADAIEKQKVSRKVTELIQGAIKEAKQQAKITEWSQKEKESDAEKPEDEKESGTGGGWEKDYSDTKDSMWW